MQIKTVETFAKPQTQKSSIYMLNLLLVLPAHNIVIATHKQHCGEKLVVKLFVEQNIQ